MTHTTKSAPGTVILAVQPGATPLPYDVQALARWTHQTPQALKAEIGELLTPCTLRIDVSSPYTLIVWVGVYTKSWGVLETRLEDVGPVGVEQTNARYWAKELADRIIVQEDEDRMDKHLVAEAVRWLLLQGVADKKITAEIIDWSNWIRDNLTLQYAVAHAVLSTL